MALPLIARQLLLFRVVTTLQQKTLATFVRGWGSTNNKWDRPPECHCILDAEQLCTAANAQELSAALETGIGTQGLPHVLTISWPDASG